MARKQIVLRVESPINSHVRAQAKAAGLSINEYCSRKLSAGMKKGASGKSSK